MSIDDIKSTLTLTEDEVVDAVAEHLKTAGWTVRQALRTTEQGVDLIATRGSERLLLEAKGGTSLSVISARYGKGFTNNQQRDHVAKAVAVACELRSCEPEAKVGIAFPDTPTHRKRIEAVRFALGLLSVWAYIVHQDRTIQQVV